MFSLQQDAMTCVYPSEDGSIVVSQPAEKCPHCNNTDVIFVSISTHRARLIAAEMLRLADEIDGAGKGHEA